ncbi:DUF3152 domain-containing protein [Streptomyces sp. NPDC006314]|uniref:DUF3152 domain-containing protein n=1 Tax=Streptomyces sp. NPDC006314 TaxID=3154475 RepID=UPI0033B7749C
MGRHSRRGPAPKDDSADTAAGREEQRGTGTGDRRDTPGQGGRPGAVPPYAEGAVSGAPRGARGPTGSGGPLAPAAPGTSQAAYPGARRPADGTPAHGVPRPAAGTPARGVPRFPDGDSARGGHPEQREAGGGWGAFGGSPGGGAGPGVVLPRQRQAGSSGGPGRRPGPRQEYLDAFEGASDGIGDVDVFAPRSGRGPRDEEAPAAEEQRVDARAADGVRQPVQRGGGKGRAFAGIAAAAVTTVLAVVVAGQVAEGRDVDAVQSQPDTDTGQARDVRAPGGESAAPNAVTSTYEQKMGRKFPLGVTLKGSGKFDAVPGFDKAPGTGQKYRYRVDVERGLGLDGALFAEAVQKTLNDDRSWSHGGARTFERISSGKPDFVITLASPGTTAEWCAKSGLDTTEDNVSCDSAATERVMINAYRWAQGSKTYGDRIHLYRQMLINHEVGHRLGNGHVTCQKNGELAPVMQQQTKFLDHDGIHCLPNPWAYPGS